MDLGLHYWTFSTPGDPQRIPETLAAAAKTTEEAGFAELSVMDHLSPNTVRPRLRCSAGSCRVSAGATARIRGRPTHYKPALLLLSKMMRVLDAVATTAPEASVTTPSVKPTREPALTTVPVAVSKPLESRTALR
jgi:hypothetical protein